MFPSTGWRKCKPESECGELRVPLAVHVMVCISQQWSPNTALGRRRIGHDERELESRSLDVHYTRYNPTRTSPSFRQRQFENNIAFNNVISTPGFPPLPATYPDVLQVLNFLGPPYFPLS